MDLCLYPKWTNYLLKVCVDMSLYTQRNKYVTE